eukprot:TRINITY_DN19663_c0_g1_i8.p1 TRINITY_DN19663_c0_g1~~TRINITY_DN19663_c0_g1_i8.p1  ORF type:complete len:107 (+),score=16.74 TRINITY_DN19663_c0_g1_i8:237-557(+)
MTKTGSSSTSGCSSVGSGRKGDGCGVRTCPDFGFPADLFDNSLIFSFFSFLGGGSCGGDEESSYCENRDVNDIACDFGTFVLSEGGEIGRAVQQECRDRSRMPSSA